MPIRTKSNAYFNQSTWANHATELVVWKYRDVEMKDERAAPSRRTKAANRVLRCGILGFVFFAEHSEKSFW
ncbi:hypothetical protein Nepgr_017944 [Nepenthes gracilis]|uniref:Uncharacterized protein n=1 Tax=Nepenthes gracilis TaxID=150966 RepID=A0AAD3SRF3_NEPGR|nr:hypothetical protein Nepgr_017944 [Nepenthes gracilis]